MKVIKFILSFILVLTLGFVGFYVAGNRGWLPQPVLAFLNGVTSGVGYVEQFNNYRNTQLNQDASSQLSILSSRAGELSVHGNQILGSYVEVNEEKQPLHERAIEYGRYLYCQQVVEEYETDKLNKEPAPSPASSTP